LQKEIDWAEGALLAQAENGLFSQRKVNVTFRDLENKLKLMRKVVRRGDYDKVQDAIDDFWGLFNKALNQADDSYWVKYVHVRAVALIDGIVLLVVLVASALFGSRIWFAGIPYWSLLLGSLGGSVRAIWWLFQHVSRKDFRRSWWLWFMVSPLVGAGLGILTYLAFYATVIASTTSAQITQPWLAMFLCGFAGFNWNWALNRLTAAGKSLDASSKNGSS
jgi:hypothetical protein